MDETRRRLGEVTKDPTRYSEILSTLIVQGLYQIMEPKTTIRSRQADQGLIQALLPKAIEEYKSKTGKDVVVTVDSESFLPADTCGGVELLALNGRLRVSYSQFHPLSLSHAHAHSSQTFIAQTQRSVRTASSL